MKILRFIVCFVIGWVIGYGAHKAFHEYMPDDIDCRAYQAETSDPTVKVGRRSPEGRPR